MRAGNRFCSKCGHQLGPAARFCSKCGRAVPASADQNTAQPGQQTFGAALLATRWQQATNQNAMRLRGCSAVARGSRSGRRSDER
jgi:predicted amidophosphoribosyltransferase